MLQQYERKKSSSLNVDLIVGGACIIHHKIDQNKRSQFHLKTDKIVSNFSSGPFGDYEDNVKKFKVSSSQKNKIKYLKNVLRDKFFREQSSECQVNKSQIPFFKKKNIYSSDQPWKEDQNTSNAPNKKLKKKINNLSTQTEQKRDFSSKSHKKILRKILPQITQKYGSNTASKQQLKKQFLFGSYQQSINQSASQTKKFPNSELPLPNLQFIEDEEKKNRIFRQNPTKISKSQNIKTEDKDTFKLKSLSNSSAVKSIKREFQSNKEIKIIQTPGKLLKQQSLKNKAKQKEKEKEKEKEKIAKLNIIRDEFTFVINQTNEIQVMNENSFFNAFVEKGNNGMLVKELIKKRWWWHFSDQDPRQSSSMNSQVQMISKQSPLSGQPISLGQKKKINLYWSEWLNRGFVEKLSIQNKQFIRLQTVYDEFEFILPSEQQRYDSIKKITDQLTFNKIKQKISLRNVNYFKNHFPKPITNHQLNSKTETLTIKDNFQKEKINFRFIEKPHEMKIHNHVIGCLELHSKKLLFKNFSSYLKKKHMNPFDFIPLTFYIEDLQSQNYREFKEQYDKLKNIEAKSQKNLKSIWILKPGQNSNRGFGISIHKQKEQIQEELIKRISLKQSQQQGSSPKKVKKSVIVQKYIQNCFLIHNRKFDFRCYILITTANGFLKGYWYEDGYIRTSSEEYNLNDIENKMIHLTNDAVQSKNSSFGKFEDYNKMSFDRFKKYLQKLNLPVAKFDEALKKMKNIAYYLIASVSPKIKRYQYTFEVTLWIQKLFGLDFMLDESLTPFLIEANSNPCLDTKGPILTKIIRNLVQNVIMTAIDPLFPSPKNIQLNKKKKEELDRDYFMANMFELIFTDKKTFQQQPY